MSLNPTIISSLTSLGEILKQYCLDTIDKKNKKLIDEYVHNAMNHNKWFTKNNIMFCFEVWSKNLSFDILKKWLSNYNFNNQSKTLGLVLAGNIPLVGLHDIICGLLCNYKLEIKLSSEDSHLIVFCLNYLSANNKLIENKISIKKDKTPTKIPFIIPMKVCFPITSKTLASETSFLARALITIARD